MKNIVLFDMDGTLTEPRKSIDWETVCQLRELQKIADIGIVSGSPYEYIQQQMSTAWTEINSLDPQRILLMPCNGTKIYEYKKEGVRKPGFSKVYETNMIQSMGKENYRILVSILTDLQNYVIESQKKVPMSGNFISFRGSMVNWCMIGRDADHKMRSEFVMLDKGLRASFKNKLDRQLQAGQLKDIQTALGGSTSIDIYPKGWDKTYCLHHISSNKNIYFVGDKCQPGGNDYELFAHPKTKSYETTGPDDTLSIIQDIMREIKRG